MGEKKGSMFNIIAVVIISSIIIAALVIFVPAIMDTITGGMQGLVDNGFGRVESVGGAPTTPPTPPTP